MYTVIGGTFFAGPGEILNLASVSTKHNLLSFDYMYLPLGEFALLNAPNTSYDGGEGEFLFRSISGSAGKREGVFIIFVTMCFGSLYLSFDKG